MQATKAATLAAVLALALGGCHSPTAPQVAPIQSRPARWAAIAKDGPSNPGPPIDCRMVRAEFRRGCVYFEIEATNVDQYLWQIFLNTDDNTSTGYARFGSEYEMNSYEAAGGLAEVRLTAGPQESPLGWGALKGHASFQVHGSILTVSIPLDAIGYPPSMGWSVQLHGAELGVAYSDGRIPPGVLVQVER
jgi:hypothetical protein